MKTWRHFLTERSKKESTNVEENQYTMFFKKDGEYYAVKEEDRIMFAKIKTKDTKDINVDKEEIKFSAKNLATGESKTFKPEDVKDIEVCDRKEAEFASKSLYKYKESKTQGGKTMCKCKCKPCLKGTCEKCSCTGCKCEGCSCRK